MKASRISLHLSNRSRPGIVKKRSTPTLSVVFDDGVHDFGDGDLRYCGCLRRRHLFLKNSCALVPFAPEGTGSRGYRTERFPPISGGFTVAAAAGPGLGRCGRGGWTRRVRMRRGGSRCAGHDQQQGDRAEHDQRHRDGVRAARFCGVEGV
jgi:hypothetical protein